MEAAIRALIHYFTHIWEEHIEGGKPYFCPTCRTYLTWGFFVLAFADYIRRVKKRRGVNRINNNVMAGNENLTENLWGAFIIIALFSAITIVSMLVEHWLKKRKYDAESENVELGNQITKEITYRQLQVENRQKNFSGEIQLYRQIHNLEKELEQEEDPQKKQSLLRNLQKIKKLVFGEEDTSKKIAEGGKVRK